MRCNTLLSLGLNVVLALGQPERPSNGSSGWQQDKFKTLVTFGDSYTDENRLGYFSQNNGSAPPPGWDGGVSYSASSGGRIWARYASIYSSLKLYNYAVSGAVCSNEITPRLFAPINAPFPDVLGYEVPAYLADAAYTHPNGSAFFTGTPSSTVYALWIGTNDVGNDAFLTDSQQPGKTLTDYTDCVYEALATLYAAGARSFVLMNLAPLHLAPQYATPENGGLAWTSFFPNKGPNLTEISFRMLETVATVNEIFAYRSPFETLIADAYPGASIANFDVGALITDIWTHPGLYLNGTAPANVTGTVEQCVGTGANRTCVRDESPDSFVWFDALHPSEQVDRVIAKEFGNVLNGESRWTEYWG